VDHEFEKNIRSILDQDFPAFTVFFILESAEDPAYEVLKNLGAANILIAGEATDCGQKVHNLQYAVRQVVCQADIYVFCDSDARYPQNWLTGLTSPLQEEHSCVCTGYRWYSVSRFQIPTLLRSAWNSTVLGLLGDHNRNFAWGGSTALHRETFERIGVLDAWRGALSDDYAITRAAQFAGVPIRFVPSCLIPSHGECSFRELLEFTNRQIIITRVYHRRLWRLGLLAQTVFNLAFWSLGLALLWTKAPSLMLLWSMIFALSAARSAVRLSAAQSRLSDPGLARFAWFYILSSPIIALLYQYNMVFSALTTHIEWRQIHYSLISPNETRVHRFRG
jgi:cellulose synthase/poly-beta-1,6-N-acetylglucosamine synthase-like glycosyltransferase